ncbi:MAG: hypothetical protein KAI45_03450, partial [Melioribacteraceae bacterium]|nr:hypothetical protein [Melioribacteraceae bacterium]
GGWVVILGDLPNGSPQVGLTDPIIKGEMKKLSELPSVINLSGEPDKINLLPTKIKEVFKPQIEMLTGNLPLLISHREIEDKDFYWIANNSGVTQRVTLLLRDGNGSAEIWDCETGEIKTAPYRKVNDINKVELQFDSYEAYWLVFDPSGKSKIVQKSEPTDLDEIQLNGPWQINYPEINKIQVTSARSLILGEPSIHDEYLNADYDDTKWNYHNVAGNIRLEGSWNAEMFYNPDPDSKRFYRYKFSLADNPKGANVNINADNKITFWVNGEKITRGKNADGWSAFDSHDIISFLKKGENLIAVEATNGLGHGVMVFQGLVQLNNGKEIEILSNTDWKQANTASLNWQTIGFDDSSWQSPLITEENISSFYFLRIRPPNKIILSNSTVWWRIDVIPNAKYLLLPDISDDAEFWIDGKKKNVESGKLFIPKNSKIIVVKNREDASGLSGPASFYCEGWNETDLVSWMDLGLRSFTGFVDYETTFDLPSKNSDLTIDLGKVSYMAEVWLNDEKIGERLWPPYTFSTESNIDGETRIRVRVGNLMVNEIRGKDDLEKLRTWGWNDPPAESFEGGLFGPVEIKIIK